MLLLCFAVNDVLDFVSSLDQSSERVLPIRFFLGFCVLMIELGSC